jgi:two-component system sensor histidine kinase BaeS
MSLPLANRLVKPIKALATATNYLSAGKFDTRVPVVSVDELGRLARNFNELAITLEKNEHTRRHWVADISHELRTPLAVLRGEIEAIQDGIRQPTSEAISSLHSETLRLGRLVEDLYQLSLFDLGGLTYRKAELDCAMMLNQTVESFRPEFTAHNIELHCELPKGNFSPLFADGERLRQLFHNILENSLKYTDPQGTLIVHLDYTTTDVQISFQDSAPGVPPESVERLFDRLYRVETSRNRATGGAGLGLAICKNIVEAHHGSIQAKQSPLGGLWLLVTLPLKGTVS